MTEKPRSLKQLKRYDLLLNEKEDGEWVRYRDVEEWRDEAAASPLLLEKLAELEHDQWAHWMRYLESKRYEELRPQPAFHSADWEHWMSQTKTPYSALSEKEKESDREWARKVLAEVFGAGSDSDTGISASETREILKDSKYHHGYVPEGEGGDAEPVTAKKKWRNSTPCPLAFARLATVESSACRDDRCEDCRIPKEGSRRKED